MTLNVKSLAAIKRALADGAAIEIVEHRRMPSLTGTIRKPTQLQGNGYWWETGSGQRSWHEYPQASSFLFNSDGTIQTSEPPMTFRLVEVS